MVIGVTPIEEKCIGQYGFERTRTNYEVSVFKKNILLSKFIYNESSGYHETFELVSEDTIGVGHWGKFGMHINLKGEHVSWPKTENSAINKKAKEENTRLIKIVKKKYLNSNYISNYDRLVLDECNFFYIKSFGDIACVCFHWDNGLCDEEDYCGGDIEIGYADEDMCYWPKDCLK